MAHGAEIGVARETRALAGCAAGGERRCRQGSVRVRRPGRWIAAGLLASLLAACGGGGGSSPQHPLDDSLRLHQVQVLGTHNSYHLLPRPELFAALQQLIPPLADAWEYEHLPLPEQFSTQGIRQIELDVWADPQGGLFSRRPVHGYVGLDPEAGIPALAEPGFKVLHVHELDFESTCWTFVACLSEVRDWSLAHPGHVPLFVLVEVKDDTVAIDLALGWAEARAGTQLVASGRQTSRLALEEGKRAVTVLDEAAGTTAKVEVRITPGRATEVP